MLKDWTKLQKPIMALAPMADVTDPAFRRVIAKYGKPDVMWTEFVSADGLYYTREKHKMNDIDNPLLKDLMYHESERPIVAQLFSSNPETMEYASKLVTELGFDGVDINMGCPHRAIEKQGAGAAMIKNPENAIEVYRAAVRGTNGVIPVSIKTRIGYNENEIETWLPMLLNEKPAALTVHARTRKEMSDVPANWEYVGRAVTLRNQYSEGTRILGNGDVQSIAVGREKVKETGADGVMIGRGVFGNPWLFSKTVPGIQDKLKVLIEHCEYFEKYSSHKSFAVMKKHFKSYCSGFENTAELRIQLMKSDSATEVREVLQGYIK